MGRFAIYNYALLSQRCHIERQTQLIYRQKCKLLKEVFLGIYKLIITLFTYLRYLK